MSQKHSKLVRRVASEFLASRGAKAVEDMLEMEAVARQIGDDRYAEEWLKLADAAAALVRERSGRRG